MKHELKILPAHFEALLSGGKTFEIRNNNDRGFQKGDTLVLREFDPDLSSSTLTMCYTGRTIERVVSYVSNYEQQSGFVVLGLKQPQLPEGWQLVPVEPTPEMRLAGVAAQSEKLKRYALAGSLPPIDHGMPDAYSAMLAAAPKPEGGAS